MMERENMEKQWKTVLKYRGYEVQTLDKASEPDEMGFRVNSWVLWHERYPNIGLAIAAIDALCDG